MNNSRSNHGVLTEPSHREGKGREGKRKGVGPKAPSMTSGRGWRATAASTRQAVSASVMDGGFAASFGGVR